MDMSSLSMEDLGRLSDLLDELSAVVNDKEDIIKNIALMDVKKMNQAIDVKTKSNEKASRFTIEDLSMSRNIEEMKTFVSSNLDSSYEMHEIDENAKRLNQELDAISLREEYLKLEIEKIIKKNAVDNSQSNGIMVDMLNTLVFILEQEIPRNIEKISPDACRIIDCGKELINEISDLLSSNITKKEAYVDESVYENFNKLRDRVNEYEHEKNKSDDKQLEMLKRPVLNEEVKEENKEEPVVQEETPTENVEETSSEEVKVEEEKPINLDAEVKTEEQPIVLDAPKVELEINEEPTVEESTNETVEQPINLDTEVKTEEQPIVLDTQVEETPQEENKIQVDSLESLENLQKQLDSAQSEPVQEVVQPEPVVEAPTIEVPQMPESASIVTGPVQQTVEQPEQPVVTETPAPVADNIVPLSSFLEPQPEVPKVEVPVMPESASIATEPVQQEVEAPAPIEQPVATETPAIQPNARTLVVEKGVDPDLVRAARTKKAKLAKIHGNTQGSYSPVRIVKFEDLNKVDTANAGFSLDSFINQQPKQAA